MMQPTKRLNPAGPAARRLPAKVERGHITTTASAYESEEQTTSAVGEARFAPGEEVAHVQVAAGMTKNLGNFESLRVDVRVTLPCHPGKVDDAYEQASEFVANKLQAELNLWLGTEPKTATRK